MMYSIIYCNIFYRIDEYNAKEVKESIFLVDARENQKALIALAQGNHNCSSQPQINNSLNTEKVSNNHRNYSYS